MTDDIAKMLAQISKAVKSKQDGLNEDEMGDAQVVAVLREVNAAYHQATRFEQGQVVVQKYPQLSGTIDAHRPALFVRYLKEPLEGYKLPGATPEHITNFKMAVVQDCVIMVLLGGKIIEFLADSREYMLHPDFITKH